MEMTLDNFVVIRCDLGDIICRDMDDAEITMACCDIKQAKILKYSFDSWDKILNILAKENYAIQGI